MTTEPQPANLKVILAFAAIYIIWGSAFYGVLLALKSFPPFLLSSLRFLIAGTVLLVYCILRRERLPTFNGIIKNMACGLAIFIGGVVCAVWAQQYLPSSLASIIISTPFWFVILDKRQWHFYFSSKWIIAGLVTALAAVILLLGFKSGRPAKGDENMQVMGILLIISGSFLWVSGSLYLKYNPANSSTYVNTTIQLLTAGIFCFAISFFNNEPQRLVLKDIRSDSLLAIIYLSLISSLITFMAYSWLIKVRPPAIVSTYAYVNPVVAVLLGWGLAHETISGLQLVALATILCGVLFINIPRYQQLRQMPKAA